MPRSLETPHLQDIAFNALANLVYCLGTCRTTTTHLKTQVHTLVPPALANNITKKLLDTVDNAQTKEPAFLQVLEDIVDAVLHPRITVLKCNFKSGRLSSLVIARLNTLNRLRVLHIEQISDGDEIIFEKSLEILYCLETLIMRRNCTDTILKTACESCTQLHTVDVSGSLLVTDRSIMALQKLNNLENVDVFATSVTLEGIDNLLQALPSTINSLGCNIATHLYRFPQLKSLHSGVFKCEASLRNLQYLNLSCGVFNDVNNLLGSKLLQLHLHYCKGVDVGIIIQQCFSLEIFEMHSCSYSIRLHQTLKDSSPGLKRLCQFTLDKSSKFPSYPNIDRLVVHCVLSSAHDIRQLYLESYAQFDEEFFYILMRSNNLMELEEMSLYAIYSEMMEPVALRHLLKRCTKLSVLNIRGYAIPGVDNFQQILTTEFSGIKINIEIMNPCGL